MRIPNEVRKILMNIISPKENVSCLEKKLDVFSNHYPLHKWGAGRFSLVGSFPHLLKEDFELRDKDILTMRAMYDQCIEDDFRSCLVPALENIFPQVYGRFPQNLEDLPQKAYVPKTEGEFVEFVLGEAKKRKIRTGVDKLNLSAYKSPVDMYVLTNEMANDFLSKSRKRLPISYMILRRKTPQSAALKLVDKLVGLLAADDKTLVAVRNSKKKGDFKMYQEELRDFTLEYLHEALVSGIDIYEYVTGKDSHGNKLGTEPSICELNRISYSGKFGGEVNDLIADCFLVDTAGVKFVFEDRDHKKLDELVSGFRKIRSSTRFNQLENKREVRHSSNKDGSEVYGIRNAHSPQFAEARLQLMSDFFEAELGLPDRDGTMPHILYKDKRVRNLRDAKNGRSGYRDLVLDSVCRFYGLEHHDLGFR